jgi:hypothetical protein
LVFSVCLVGKKKIVAITWFIGGVLFKLFAKRKSKKIKLKIGVAHVWNFALGEP